MDEVPPRTPSEWLLEVLIEGAVPRGLNVLRSVRCVEELRPVPSLPLRLSLLTDGVLPLLRCWLGEKVRLGAVPTLPPLRSAWRCVPTLPLRVVRSPRVLSMVERVLLGRSP